MMMMSFIDIKLNYNLTQILVHRFNSQFNSLTRNLACRLFSSTIDTRAKNIFQNMLFKGAIYFCNIDFLLKIFSM